MTVERERKQLHDGVQQQNFRSIARAISFVENRREGYREFLAELSPAVGPHKLLGVTGPPGAGKSTLVDSLALEYLQAGSKVAILAVDPSSPFSGGAVLGDRVRMMKASGSEKIFVRSMATRGSLGGVAAATRDAADVLAAGGFDTIIVETVGVGQAEIDIVRMATTCLVVLVPGMGDSVQAMKAGILEIADIFVLNKADRDGIDFLERDLQMLLSSVEEQVSDGWQPPLQRTVATKSEGVEELLLQIQDHQQWLGQSEGGFARRVSVQEHRLSQLLAEELLERTLLKTKGRVGELAVQCARSERGVYEALAELRAEIGWEKSH